MNMDNDLVVHTRLVDRPDSEQLDPFFLETPLEWRNLEALVSVTVSCVFVFVFFFSCLPVLHSSKKDSLTQITTCCTL